MRALALIFAMLAALFALPASAQEFPPLTGRVVDAANILPPEVEAQLTQKLAALETQSQRQLVVATVPSLQGYEISDYGYQLGRHWGLGDKERNDGAILLVAPNERKVRIEVGYGLEPVLTDGFSSLIIQNDILPRFKASDMPGGIVAGTDAIIKQLQLPADQAQQIAAEADKRQSSEGIPASTIVWVIFVLIFFVLPLFRRRGGRRYNGSLTGSTMGDILLWEAGKAAARGFDSDSGWGGGDGFGGGGGFSGGGGSFGGGGASGGW